MKSLVLLCNLLFLFTVSNGDRIRVDDTSWIDNDDDNEDYKFQLTGCTTTDAIFSESLHDVPNDLDKIWTLVKTSEELIILCNEVQVMRMVYRERVDKHYSECYSKWSQVVSHISLIKGVTAYRSAECLSFPPTWYHVTFKDPTTNFPLSYGSNHDLACHGAFALDGDVTVGCAGGSDYTYSASPLCVQDTGRFKFLLL
ncbi:hypothetical protein ACHWQZ_G005275 [Mnemiopsis leidyi]